MSQEEANSFRNDEFHIPTIPSEDWEMNVFLNELADDLTKEDLKKMKYLLTGLNGTGKRVLEVINDGLDLFEHLKQKQILTRDNVVCLQAMLWHTKRKDLHNKFVQFARKRGNVVHFYAPNDKPENGYEYVKFHIGGKEKLDRNKLEELRMLVSRVICVPLDFIIVSGIEATNSILITFMVPEGYATILADLTDKEKEYLGCKGVDAIWYNGCLINCIDVKCPDEHAEIDKDAEVKILLDQKSKLDKNVEDLQIEVLKLQQKLRGCQKREDDMQKNAQNRIATIAGVLVQQFVGTMHTPEKMSLENIALKNAVKQMRHTMKKMEGLGYDTDLIQYLLDANTIVTRTKIGSDDALVSTIQQHEITRLQHDLCVLQYERDKLAYLLEVGISEPVLTRNERYLLHFLTSLFPMQVTETVKVSISQTKEMNIDILQNILTGIFKTWQETLSKEEKLILFNKFLPTSESRKAFKESKLLLLEYLWLNYAKSNGLQSANFHLWMVNVLATIKRMDLCESWASKASVFIKAFTNGENQEDEDVGSLNSTSKVEKKSFKKSKHSSNGKKGKPSNQSTTLPIEAQPNRSTLEEVNERLQHIEEIMDRNTKITETFVFSKWDKNRSFGSHVADNSYDVSKLFNSKLFNKI